ELIQNAEDAGAKEVKFLIDHHSYGTDNVQHPGLAKFQYKVKDPTKVGRFGLGFKSVFHMTDLPSVLSGDSLGIIDPHEKYFSDEDGKRSGIRWNLTGDAVNMRGIADQFAPYKEVFGGSEDAFQQGSYEGTLFRLPFRQEPSKLSDTIYSTEKIQGLFKSFLLPLSNKTFTDFMKKSSTCINAVYIDSPDHPKSLLPGMLAKFLDSDIDVDIKKKLENAVRQGYTQLRDFDKVAVENHLHEALPTEWTQSNGHVIWHPGKSNHPTFQWLEELWGYFGRHFNDTNGLHGFRGLPLIPVSMENKKEIQLVRIQRPSSLVLQSFNREQIDSSVSNVLSPFGVIVLKNLPVFLMRHHTLVPDYVNPPNPKGVLDALIMAVISNPQSMSVLSFSDMRPLRGFLSRIATLTPKERDFLKKLKLFNTHPGSGGQSRHVSLLEVPLAAPVDDFPPVRLCTDMVDLRDGNSKTLAQLLGTVPMSHVELVKIMLSHALHGMYSDTDIDGLVEYTLNRFNMYHGQGFEEIKRLLTSLPFIMSVGNTRKKPGEMFDPEDKNLTEMFLNEPEKFPKVGSYYAKSNVLVHLRALGLKKETDVTASNILFSARMVNEIQDVMKATTKSEAILERLQHAPLLLQHKLVNSTTDLLSQLNSMPWVPVFDKRSETYPTALLRKYESSFACPKDATSAKFLYLVGSSKTLVDVQDNSQVSHCFGWDKEPAIDEVISHLRNVILSYQEKEKNTFISVIKAIYRYLASQDINNVIGDLNVQQIHKWVWNGDGFSSPSEVILYVPWFNLQPYLCSLPSETKEFATFFSKCGMKLECDNNLLLNILRRIKERHVELEYNHNTSCYDVKRDLQYSIDILNVLKPQNGEALESGLRENLLVPVNVEDDTSLELVPVDECTYCDREWLKQGHDVIDIDDTDDVKIKFIHRNIPTATAEVLGVPTLMSRILDADELEMGESFGQSESLLDRLKGLLEGYTDGLSVPKELIQNADDAGATEVRFLYDERTNDDAMTHLIDEGMKECQGPALWSYNDAVFTNDDFQNIVKLNAATKEEDTGKIGRFGLGFNSVYNLTDVPSFVSRESIVILDPHTTYLGKAIRDKSKPGIKFNLTTKTLRRLANQFKPYNGVFGCDLRPDGSIKSYDGTLFRFPLRTKTQAHKSGIKQLHYDVKQVKELLRMLLFGSESLLLFTQNVLTIRVYHLSNEKTGVPQPIELFSISKSCVNVIHRLTREVSLSIPVQSLTQQKQDFVKQSNILRVSSDLLKVTDKGTIPPAQVLMKSALILTNPRKHPVERVFEDSWKPLQGPALCVYNNAPFTNSDIIGIQNLGEGNKGDDPNKTGQYGIGFNAVYHLTDVPSFISKGEEIGERYDDNNFQDSSVVINVMTHIYQFLQTNLQNDESAITTGLQKTRCIVVEDDAFTVFYPGEYVGYELDDPSLRDEDGAATYIYAIIMEEVPSGEEASPITKRYRIDIGKELIVVDAVDLYKFCRRKQGSEGLEIEVFTGSETAEQQEVKPDNLDEAKQLVRKTLEEAWHLPEEKRKKIIKRLFLTWHPDKNPGNEEFCTEVFKFIQAEIMRLETGVDPQRAGNFWSSAGYGNFSSYYRRWSGRARDHGTQRSSYFSGGCSSSSYRRCNPQPGEATRWYRQATKDLNAASNDVIEYRPSYEWACFKCHQSAEKALKAAQYSRDADKSSTHNLSGIASSLGNSELISLAYSMECLLGDSTRMRYPDRVQCPNIPHDIYTRNMATQALELAREILNVVKAKFV
ncbi:hypothetical protein QZH41_016544, partial [Actinostola sp. cb2023]